MFTLLPRGMKNGTIVLGSALLVLAGSVHAQPPAGGGQQGGGRGGMGGGGPGGQMGMMMGGMRGMGGMDAPFSAADIDRIGKIINLTNDQKDAAKTLLEGYVASFREKADVARAEMDKAREDFRENRDPSVFTGLRDIMTKLGEARREFETSFMNDVKALLTDEQQANWPKVEMAHRREQTIRRGLLSGERVDLIRMVEQMNLADEVKAPVLPILDSYASDLDRELQKRNELYEKGMQQGMQMFQNGDIAGVQKMYEEGREASVRVREVNRRYAKQIEGSLPPEEAAKFAAEFKRESFPQVYRDRYPTQALKAAAAITDLDDSQRAGIKSLQETYDRESASINDKYEKAIEAQEQSFNPTQFMQGGGGAGRGPGGGQGGGQGGGPGGGGFAGMFDNPQMQEVRNARRDLDNRTVEALKGILTEQQRTLLPEQRAGGGDNPGQRQQGQGGQQQQRRRGGNQPGNDPNQPPPRN